MSAAATGRTHDSTRPVRGTSEIRLAKTEPSTHDPKGTLPIFVSAWHFRTQLAKGKLRADTFAQAGKLPSWRESAVLSGSERKKRVEEGKGIGAMDEREAYEKKVKAQMEQWQAEIDTWSAMAKQAQADAQLKYNEQLEQLRARRDEAQEHLQKLQNASDKAWDDLRKGMEDAWRELGRSIETARARFK